MAIPPVPPGVIPITSWQVQFAPSADHHRNSIRYVLEVFKADFISRALALDLGRPAVSNGLCTVDVSGAVAILAAGGYLVSVRAVDDATGLSSLAATTTFAR